MNKQMINIGDIVSINSKSSIYNNEWGTVIYIDEDNYYHVAIANGRSSVPIFERNELRLSKKYNH